MEKERRPTFAMIFSKEDGTKTICFAEAEETTVGLDGIKVLVQVVEGKMPDGKFETEVFKLMTSGENHKVPPDY